VLRAQYDAKRQAYLEAQDITVLRFENKMILNAPEDVLHHIRAHFTDKGS